MKRFAISTLLAGGLLGSMFGAAAAHATDTADSDMSVAGPVATSESGSHPKVATGTPDSLSSLLSVLDAFK